MHYRLVIWTKEGPKGREIQSMRKASEECFNLMRKHKRGPRLKTENSKTVLIGNPPPAEPVQMIPLLTRPFDAKHNHPEVHKHRDYDSIK